MKKNIIKTCLLLLIMSLLLNSTVFAFEDSNIYISYTSGSISSTSSGYLTVSFSVTANEEMSTLGAQTIELYSLTNGLVKTFRPSEYPSMLTKSSVTYNSSVSCSMTSRETYYAIITFYAEKQGNSTTATLTTRSYKL